MLLYSLWRTLPPLISCKSAKDSMVITGHLARQRGRIPGIPCRKYSGSERSTCYVRLHSVVNSLHDIADQYQSNTLIRIQRMKPKSPYSRFAGLKSTANPVQEFSCQLKTFPNGSIRSEMYHQIFASFAVLCKKSCINHQQKFVLPFTLIRVWSHTVKSPW